MGQFALLRHLKMLGTVNVSTLADKIRLDRTTLVRTLKPLEEAALVKDVSLPGKRNRELCLTEKGQEVYLGAERLWDDAQRHTEEELGGENLALLTALLSRIENMR